MKTQIQTLVIGLFCILSSCDGFLDEDPKSSLTSANFYQTEEDAIAATNALYDYLSVGTDYLWNSSFGGIFFNDFWVFQDLLSDNCFENTSVSEYRQLSEFKFTSDNERIEYYWQDLYKTINAANVVISKSAGIDMDNDRKNHLISEARFIRAMMYFEGVKLFGDVPLLLAPTTNMDDSYVDRSSADEVYIEIISDLEFAELNLMKSFRYGNGRPTSMSATALLAKVYLTKGDYTLAAEKAKDVIDSGQYSLWEDYSDIFKIANMNKGEIIFAVNFSGTLSEGFKPNQYHVRLLPSGLDKDGEGPENAHSMELPTGNLYNSFVQGDRRKDVTFISSYTYSDGTTVKFDPHIGKFWDQEAEPRGNETNSDVIYLRFADILLIYAEALNEINNGPVADAYDAINQVRKRARFNGIVELNILPDLSGLGYQDFKDAILLERRWEFVMEGQRWNDLVRMNKLVEKVIESNKENATPSDYHCLLPIPQREREINSELSQNEGY